MAHFDFAAENIVANRTGRMTQPQAKILRRSLVPYQGTLIFLNIVLLPVMWGTVTIGHNWIAFGLCGILLMGGLSFLLGFQWMLWKDASDSKVIPIMGKLRTINTGGKGTTQLELYVDDMTGARHIIKANREYAKLFRTNTSYTFFIAPRSRILLSAEEIAR